MSGPSKHRDWGYGSPTTLGGIEDAQVADELSETAAWVVGKGLVIKPADQTGNAVNAPLSNKQFYDWGYGSPAGGVAGVNGCFAGDHNAAAGGDPELRVINTDDNLHGDTDTVYYDGGIYSPDLAQYNQAHIAVRDFEYADNGGELVVLLGTWGPLSVGPYFVRLYSAGGTAYPAIGDCLSATLGNGTKLYPSKESNPLTGEVFYRRVTFIMPPAPPGVYNIEIKYGGPSSASSQHSMLLEQAVSVVVRSRSRATYRIRNAYPPLYKTGPRLMSDEKAVVTL